MKTGFVCASGYNIVGAANRGGRQLMVVVLGAHSSKKRAETAAILLNRGFGDYYSGRPHPLLASFETQPSTTPLANLRDQVCRRGGIPEDPDPLLASLGTDSALVPRFQVMAPVRVYTGRADGTGGSPAVRVPAAKVPLPRLRPRTALGSAPPAYAEEPPPSPTAIAIKPPLDLTRLH